MAREIKDILTFRYNVINEGKDGRFKVQGRFQVCDEINGNGRIYPRTIWEKVLNDQNFLENVNRRRMLGELDHPTDGKTSLKNASHVITEVKMNPGGEIVGEAEILDTPQGKILQELFRAGVEVGISSRGSGSVKEDQREGKKVEVVQDDYNLKTWDFVSEPSTPKAYPIPISEDQEKNLGKDKKKMAENLTATAKQLSERINTLKSSIREGCDYNALSEKLFETQVDVSKLGEDTAYKVMAESLAKDLNETRVQLDNMRKVDPQTSEGQAQQLGKAKAIIKEMVRRFNNLKEEHEQSELVEAEKFTQALYMTLEQFPFEEMLNDFGLVGQSGINEDFVEQLVAQNEDLAKENELLQRQVVEYKKNFEAALQLSEALAVTGRKKQVRSYAESLVKGRNDGKTLLPMLLEGKSIPDIAQRYKYLTENKARVAINESLPIGQGNGGKVNVITEGKREDPSLRAAEHMLSKIRM